MAVADSVTSLIIRLPSVGVHVTRLRYGIIYKFGILPMVACLVRIFIDTVLKHLLKILLGMIGWCNYSDNFPQFPSCIFTQFFRNIINYS